MRILITNNGLADRAGSELYVRDLALALLSRGHTPIAYSTRLGDVAQEMREASVPVIDNLDALGIAPDIIHGHHHLDTMCALLRFPGVPAVYFCHGWIPWEEHPPRFPRILQYVAVDETCYDRLILESGIPAERARVLLNFVDLQRFKPREPLPIHPQRALIFSNAANEDSHLPAVREACSRYGITLDVVGASSGNVCAQPEEILGRYDIVFAKGRAALESLAVGAAVVLCDARGVGPMVTTNEFERLRPLNFGLRALRNPVSPDMLYQQITRYDAEDTAKVSQLVRASAGREKVVDQIISLYLEVIAENEGNASDGLAESAAAAAYLRFLSPRLKTAEMYERRTHLAESARDELRVENDQVRARLVEQDQALQTLSAESTEALQRCGKPLSTRENAVQTLSLQMEARLDDVEQITSRLEEKEESLNKIRSSLAEKESQLERIKNSFGWRLLSRYGPIKYRVLRPAKRGIGKLFRLEPRVGSNETDKAAGYENEDHFPEPTSSHQINQPPLMEEVFSDIYRRRAWGEDCESVSGPGSSLERTSVFRDAIAALVREINVRTLLDAGCGDFNWMKLLGADLDQYIGVDVVPGLIRENQRKYGSDTRIFLDLDITRDRLRRADLIFSRDCLVHLSFVDIFSAIRNFKNSGATYLLTTTFTSLDENTDTATGGWRPLNLQIHPFDFPQPIKLIDEKRSLPGGLLADKYLALWALKDITL